MIAFETPKAPFVILSAERAEHNASANGARTARLIEELESRDYVPTLAIGYWQVVTEVSLIVSLDSDRYVQWHVGELLAIAKRFDQDAILYVQFSGRATLITSAAPDTDVDVGVWTLVDQPTALASEGYTLVNGEYYVAV